MVPMQINSVAHTFSTAGDFAAARAFCAQVLPFLGRTIVADTPPESAGQGLRAVACL
jgi:hypothetical protein